jgi:tRNA A37 threonylcarbamoyladenosine synthetase subunit TsaC/SUA5/YrdC
MGSTWPGPNTWLVPHQDLLPEWVTGQHDTVALRVSDHPQVRELCALVGPLISTSCNPAGARRPRPGCGLSSTSMASWTWCWVGRWGAEESECDSEPGYWRSRSPG